MTFPIPRRYEAKVVKLTYLNEITLEVKLKFENRLFIFIPGQFVNVLISEDIYRAYSIGSDYKNSKEITLILTIGHNGFGSNYFKRLKVDDAVTVLGPSGRFILNRPLLENVYFIVTGTGIVPILSYLYRLLDLKTKSNINLYFGLRYEKDIFAIDFLEYCKNQLTHFNYDIYISKPFAGCNYNKGRVTDYVLIENSKNSQAYVCGNPNMIKDVVILLKNQGMNINNIYAEKFVLGTKS